MSNFDLVFPYNDYHKVLLITVFKVSSPFNHLNNLTVTTDSSPHQYHNRLLTTSISPPYHSLQRLLTIILIGLSPSTLYHLNIFQQTTHHTTVFTNSSLSYWSGNLIISLTPYLTGVHLQPSWCLGQQQY